MQFLLIGHDGTDPDAPARRAAARPAHLEQAGQLQAEGRLLYAVAILDDAGGMRGSAMVYDFPSRADLDAWLRREPYVTGDVWRTIQIHPCKVGPTFAGGH